MDLISILLYLIFILSAIVLVVVILLVRQLRCRRLAVAHPHHARRVKVEVRVEHKVALELDRICLERRMKGLNLERDLNDPVLLINI